MEIVKIEMNLKAVNKEVAAFNCEKKVSGVIHSTTNGETTVILDGGYVLASLIARTAPLRRSACWYSKSAIAITPAGEPTVHTSKIL